MNRKGTPTIQGVPFFCAHDQIVNVDDLVPHPKNMNHHPEEQIAILAKLISEHGFRAPVTVSTRSGFIVRGHGRLRAALKLNLPKVPVDFQDYPDERMEFADLVADNTIPELSMMNYSQVLDLAEHLDDGHFDMERLGIPSARIEEMMTGFALPKPAKVICAKCGHEQTVNILGN